MHLYLKGVEEKLQYICEVEDRKASYIVRKLIAMYYKHLKKNKRERISA